MAISTGSVFGEVVDGARTASLISSVDEDHTITATGSINVDPLPGRGLVQVNVADYSSTLTNDGRLTAPEGIQRTRAAIDINGDLSGAVVNSGTISMGAAFGDSAVLHGIDVSGNVTGAIQNTGTIDIANSALTFGTAAGINVNQVDGTLANSGTISVGADLSSRVFASGVVAQSVNGTFRNSGGIAVDAVSSGGNVFADGIELTTVAGTVENSGPVTASATARTTASVDGIGIGDLSGDLNNTGVISVTGNGGANANGDAIEISTVSGNLHNSGALTVSMTAGSTGAANFDAIEVSNLTGSLTNSGSIDGQAIGGSAGADGIDIGSLSTAARFDNSGLVTIRAIALGSGAVADGLDFADVDGSVTNSGQLIVTSNGDRARARGIQAEDLAGTLDNSGQIFVDARAGNQQAFAYGIEVGDISGQLTNAGPLIAAATGSGTVTATGILAETVTGTLANTGPIWATGRGRTANAIGIEAGHIVGTLNNTNSISATAIGTGTGDASGISTNTVDGTLSNSGNVTVQIDASSHASAYGISLGQINGAMNNSGAITVDVINGSSVEAIGIRSSTVAGTFSNSGQISVAAQGSYVSAGGIRIGGVVGDADFNNTGTISVKAQSNGSSAYAYGISAGTIEGTLSNSGNLTVVADGATASAMGIRLGGTSGQVVNSGIVLAKAAGTQSVYARGFETDTISDSISNSGTVAVTAVGRGASEVFATGASASLLEMGGSISNSGKIVVAAQGDNGTFVSANGVSANILADGHISNSGELTVTAESTQGGSVEAVGVGLGFLFDSTDLSNSGSINVSAKGDGVINAEASGVRIISFLGELHNSGRIGVSLDLNDGVSGSAVGTSINSIDTSGILKNSGTIAVGAKARNTAELIASGILIDGGISGVLDNSGAIAVAADGSDQVRAYGVKARALNENGVLSHSGSIAVAANGGDVEAYGLYVGTAEGTINVTGDIAVKSAGKGYAIYLGDGGGTLNLESTANIDGLMRVSDHDVNLTHVGGKVIYRFRDDDTSNGVFTTSVSAPSQGWFVDDEGGAAPVYASIDAREFQPNTNQAFEVAGLSYVLTGQLDKADSTDVSRDRVVLSTSGSGAIEGFRPYFLVSGSRSDGTSNGSSLALSSNMWSASAGLTRDLGAGLRYGFGASYFKNDGTFGATSFDTSGVFVSGIVAQNFGVADVSFGLGYGDLDHNETRVSGNTRSAADYSSDMITAFVAAERDFVLEHGAVLTPRASFLYGEQNLDAYTEMGSRANATVGARDITFNETRIGAAYTASLGGGNLSASLAAVHRDADAPSIIDVAVFGNTLALASGGSGTDTFGEVGLSYERAFKHGGNLRLEARSTLGADVSTQALWASYEWSF